MSHFFCARAFSPPERFRPAAKPGESIYTLMHSSVQTKPGESIHTLVRPSVNLRIAREIALVIHGKSGRYGECSRALECRRSICHCM